MIDLREEADRHADMIRRHVERTGGVEASLIASRVDHPSLAIPATFDTVEAKEEGLELFRATFQALGCTHVAWISEAWAAAALPARLGPSPRHRPDHTEALMIVVEDAAGNQAVRIDPFSKTEGGVRWGETIRESQAERQLLSGPVGAAPREHASLVARRYRRSEPRTNASAGPGLFRRVGTRVE